MTIQAQYRKGASAPHFVAFVSGMPWALAGDQAVIDALAGDTVTRRHLFGAARSLQAPHPAGDVYPADTLPIFPGLEPPGAQTTKLDQDHSWVDCGTWQLVIDKRRYGTTWPDVAPITGHARRGQIVGLEGVGAIADPRYSANVLRGALSRTIVQPATAEAVTSIYLNDCELLADRITTAAANDECVWLWCGTEAMGAYAISDLGDGEYMVSVTRGILRTRPHAHYIGDWEGSAPIVCDAPLGGIAHRPVALYSVTLAADGSVDDWFRVRHGVVSPSVATKSGKTTINCNGYTDALKASLPTRTARAQLRGYNISRPATDLFEGYYNDDIGEWFGAYVGGFRLMRYAGGVIQKYDVWFTTIGTTEFFEDWAAVRDRINTELAECCDPAGAPVYGSDMIPIQIECTDYGLVIDPNEVAGTVWVVYGQLAILLRLGICKIGDYETIRSAIYSGNSDGVTRSLYCCSESGGPFAVWGYPDLAPFTESQIWPDRFRAQYLSMPDMLGVGGSMIAVMDNGYFVLNNPFVAATWPPAHASLALSLDYPVDSYAAGDRITIGLADRTQTSTPNSVLQLNGTVASVDVPNNLIVLADATADGYTSEMSGTAAIRQVDNDSCFSFCSAVTSYVPYVHGTADPWPVDVATSVEHDVAAELFMDLFGDRTGTNLVPAVYRFDSIADTLDRVITIGPVDYYDQRASIDWQSFADMITAISGTVPETYSIKLSDGQTQAEVSPYALLRGLLLSHGVTPSWEPDALARTELMRFRSTGIVNVTSAMLEGRTATESDITDSDHSENHTLTPAYQRADIRICNNGGEYLLQFPVVDRNAYGVTANRGRSLYIEDRVTQLALGETQAEKQAAIGELSRAIVERTVRPRTLPLPVVQFSQNSRRWFDLGVGRELLITDRSMSDPFTGELSLSGKAALVTSIKRDVAQTDAGMDIEAIIAARPTYGWAPAMFVDANNSVVLTADTVRITPELRYFSHPLPSVRSDLSWFDCYIYSLALGQLVPSGCTCLDYAVRAVERYNLTPTVYPNLTIEFVSIIFNSAILRGVGLGLAWDVTLPYIIRYEGWDDAALQPCQRFFACAADDDGLLVDSGAAATNGHSWG